MSLLLHLKVILLSRKLLASRYQQKLNQHGMGLIRAIYHQSRPIQRVSFLTLIPPNLENQVEMGNVTKNWIVSVMEDNVSITFECRKFDSLKTPGCCRIYCCYSVMLFVLFTRTTGQGCVYHIELELVKNVLALFF